MHSRLHLLDRLAPVPAASRMIEHSLDATVNEADGWMTDIPRVQPARSAMLTPQRIAALRERVASGVYHTRGYADDMARRIIASGDLQRA